MSKRYRNTVNMPGHGFMDLSSAATLVTHFPIKLFNTTPGNCNHTPKRVEYLQNLLSLSQLDSLSKLGLTAEKSYFGMVVQKINGYSITTKQNKTCRLNSKLFLNLNNVTDLRKPLLQYIVAFKHKNNQLGLILEPTFRF